MQQLHEMIIQRSQHDLPVGRLGLPRTSPIDLLKTVRPGANEGVEKKPRAESKFVNRFNLLDVFKMLLQK
jgi:hypothetical protein